MNLLDQKVKSKFFGEGIIIESSSNYVVVKFESKESKFIYPDAFQNHIIALNADLQQNILLEIENKNREHQKMLQLKKDAEVKAQSKNISCFEKKFGDDYHVNFLSKQPILTYSQVENQFGIRIAGFGRGINVTNDAIMLISSIGKSKMGFVYHDRFTSEGDYIYSGEGKTGDQSFKGGNSALKNAMATGKKIYLFVKFSPQEYYYQGEFAVIGYTHEDEHDANGLIRKELQFRLKKID